MKPNLLLFIILWAIILLFGALFTYSLVEYLNTPDYLYTVNESYELWGIG